MNRVMSFASSIFRTKRALAGLLGMMMLVAAGAQSAFADSIYFQVSNPTGGVPIVAGWVSPSPSTGTTTVVYKVPPAPGLGGHFCVPAPNPACH